VQELQHDVDALARRVGELQSERWKLEDQLKTTEEELRILKMDNEGKSKLLREYMVRDNAGVQLDLSPFRVWGPVLTRFLRYSSF
jgi:chromosome segregation ATPase